MAKDNPLYVMIAKRMVEDFGGPGDEVERRLPSELALAKRYGVSRTTVREALRQLESDGTTSSRHGVGTFMVAGNRKFTFPADTLVGYGNVFKGPDVSTVLVSCTERDITAEQTSEYGWPSGRAVRLERLRLIDDDVVAYSIDNSPVEYLGGQVDTESLVKSFFGSLEKNGHKPCRAISSLRALVTPAKIVKHMPSCKNGSIIFSEELVFDQSDKVVAVSSDYLDTKLFNLQVERRVVQQPKRQ